MNSGRRPVNEHIFRCNNHGSNGRRELSSGRPKENPNPMKSQGRVLDIAIDRKSPVPLYHQFAQQLEQAIGHGLLLPGALVEKGLLARRRGIGTQVVHSTVKRPLELTSLYDDLEEAGRSPGTRVVRNDVMPRARPCSPCGARRTTPPGRPWNTARISTTRRTTCSSSSCSCGGRAVFGRRAAAERKAAGNRGGGDDRGFVPATPVALTSPAPRHSGTPPRRPPAPAAHDARRRGSPHPRGR